MKLEDTIDLMLSDNYQDRFLAEFYQIKIRIDGLETMLKKYRNGTLGFTPNCKIETLEEQLRAMIKYENCLVLRAEEENINIKGE